ncbi:MAG: hypothetical protein J7J98_09710 [candidate division Zixibacteria bacterium]|nr:hypothetical protein [candidate division Zixibacteria bacterium]
MWSRLCFVFLIVVVAIGAMLLTACGGSDLSDPRQTVISLFGAMEKDDEAALTHLLDLPELMRQSQEDYAVQRDEARVFTNPEQVLKDLTGDGETKKIWFAHQRIVANAEIIGETATVEVTFVDKEASRGYRTKFGLHLKNGEWRIFSFKTFTE